MSFRGKSSRGRGSFLRRPGVSLCSLAKEKCLGLKWVAGAKRFKKFGEREDGEQGPEQNNAEEMDVEADGEDRGLQL
jgi:hypothetical protein